MMAAAGRGARKVRQRPDVPAGIHQHRPPARRRVDEPGPTNDSVASASTKAGSRRVTCVAIAEAAAGARWRTTMRTGPAPVARAASTCSRRDSTATIARTGRATNGQPTAPSRIVSSQKTCQGSSTSGIGPQRQDDVDGRQDDEKVGDPHEGLIDQAPRVARGRPDQRARDEREEAGDERDAEGGTGPVEEAREDVASDGVRSENEQRRCGVRRSSRAGRPVNHDRGTRRDRSIS